MSRQRRTVALLAAIACLAVVATEVILACTAPPRLAGKGMRSNATISYSFIGSHSFQSCIETAITKWNAANASSGGSGVQFVPAGSGSPAMTFTMVKVPM